jgi:hypothetical protein
MKKRVTFKIEVEVDDLITYNNPEQFNHTKQQVMKDLESLCDGSFEHDFSDFEIGSIFIKVADEQDE